MATSASRSEHDCWQSDAESDDDLGEPICPGSDKEFPDIDDGGNW